MEACCASPRRTASRESGSGSGSPGRGQSFSGLGRETSVAPGRKQASRRELDVQPEPAAEEGVAPSEAGGNQAWDDAAALRGDGGGCAARRAAQAGRGRARGAGQVVQSSGRSSNFGIKGAAE